MPALGKQMVGAMGRLSFDNSLDLPGDAVHPFRLVKESM